MAHRLALIAAGLLLALAAPAGAHVRIAETHRDTRAELASVAIADTVETVEQAAGTAGDGLPEEWCGTERTTDDVANAAFDPAKPQFKVVYAYAADRTSRFDQWKHAIQADASMVGRFMGAQSGGRRTPRFDMGTSCGAEYVDIEVVQLPQPRATYVDAFETLEAAVRAELDIAGPRNVVVYADGLSSLAPGHWWGLGTSYLDDRPGALNLSNHGDIYSALWIPAGEPVPAAGGWWPEGLLHEMTHNLGAVQDSAPHASLAGHCTDGFDVMCYADTPTTAYEEGVCDEIPGVMNQVYDCGNDDYFNVAPAAGSYLATSWNVYDNAYLGSCATLAPACGADGGAIPKPPVATADPRIAGGIVAGSELSATMGTWINTPQSFITTWERSSGAGWATIQGAAGTRYRLTAADVGRRLRVRVVAANADGSTVAYSVATGVVAAPPAAPAGTGGGAVVQPSAPPPPPPPGATGPRAGRAALKIARGRGRGRRIGTIAFSISNGRLKALRSRVKLARGRYVVKLCTTAGGSDASPLCTVARLRVRRARRVALPLVAIAVPPGATGRASYAITGRKGRFSARTAKRPSAGLLLHG